MKVFIGFLSLVIAIAWLSVARAGLFPNGPNPEFPKVLMGASKSPEDATKRTADVEKQPFRSSWVVEFNEVLTSIEDFANQYNVVVRRIADTNFYSVRQKHAAYDVDKEMENLLASDPRVRSIESEIPQKRVLYQVPTTDPGLCEQWHLLQCPEATEKAVDINVKPVWEKGYTGNGIQIAIVDSGVEYEHPDIAAGYSAADSYDFLFDDDDPSDDAAFWYHGTSCAGLATAHSNSYCGVGVAYNAKFAAIKLIGALGVTPSVEAEALTYHSDKNDIYSNSWGPVDDGKTFASISDATSNALRSIAGRGGKGSIYLFAVGNGRQTPDQASKTGLTSHPHVIGVGATNKTGIVATYSEYGSNVFIAAPGGDYGTLIYTTTGGDPECTSEFSGTSAATPIVAGAVALILEANPDLTYRDVRRILGLTAQKNHRTDNAWLKNGANHWVNYNYGFGVVDAAKAVEAAENWINLPPLSEEFDIVSLEPNEATGAAKCYQLQYTVNLTIEYVLVYVDVSHTFRGDMAIWAISPMGTPVVLLFADQDSNNDISWIFSTYYFMDEYSAGTWQICFEDKRADLDVGTVKAVEFAAIGRPIENFVTTATMDSVLPGPYLNESVNITITFSDDEGIFAYSIGLESITLGSQYPVAVEVVATTLSSATAVFTFDLSANAFGEDTFEIRTTDIAVQNQWLKPMTPNTLIGSVDVIPRPPLPPQAPPQVQPLSAPGAANTPSGQVSVATASTVASIVTAFCALISVV